MVKRQHETLESNLQMVVAVRAKTGRWDELLQFLSESIPVGIYVLQRGAIQFVNPYFEAFLGYKEYELVGGDYSGSY